MENSPIIIRPPRPKPMAPPVWMNPADLAPAAAASAKRTRSSSRAGPSRPALVGGTMRLSLSPKVRMAATLRWATIQAIRARLSASLTMCGPAPGL